MTGCKSIIYNQQQGYVALMAAIVIMLLLILLSTTLSLTGFFARFDILNAEYKERSIALAEACGDSALINLANNPAYVPPAGGDYVAVNNDKCEIVSISPPAGGQDRRAALNRSTSSWSVSGPSAFAMACLLRD